MQQGYRKAKEGSPCVSVGVGNAVKAYILATGVRVLYNMENEIPTVPFVLFTPDDIFIVSKDFEALLHLACDKCILKQMMYMGG